MRSAPETETTRRYRRIRDDGSQREILQPYRADVPKEQPAEGTGNEGGAEYGQHGQKRDCQVVTRKKFRRHARGTIAINREIIIFEKGSERGYSRGLIGLRR